MRPAFILSLPVTARADGSGHRGSLSSRYRDATRQGQGYVVVLDDDDLCELLTMRERANYNGIDDFLLTRFNALVL